MEPTVCEQHPDRPAIGINHGPFNHDQYPVNLGVCQKCSDDDRAWNGIE